MWSAHIDVIILILADFLKVSSSGGHTLAKITNTLKKNTMEKLKEFVSLFGLYFDCCTALNLLVKMHV